MSTPNTYVIGDIHAGLKALQQLLKKVRPKKTDTLLFLGDYIDGWSQAVETIDFLISLKTQHHCIFIRGNHDALCYEWLTENKDNPKWHKHGGQATVHSYAKASEATKQAHIRFYENLQDYYLDDKNRLFLHAGFSNLKGVAHEYFDKTFYWDRTLWELALALHPNLEKEDVRYPPRLKIYNEIFIGHTPVTRINETTPQNKANVWNIDTGAAFKGPLTALDINTKEFWQSNPVYTFYPDEKGRN